VGGIIKYSIADGVGCYDLNEVRVRWVFGLLIRENCHFDESPKLLLAKHALEILVKKEHGLYNNSQFDFLSKLIFRFQQAEIKLIIAETIHIFSIIINYLII